MRKGENVTTFILITGVFILCVFTGVLAKNLVLGAEESDSYYSKVEESMDAKIESLEMKDGKLQINLSGNPISYCVKMTKSIPNENSLCWKKVEENPTLVSVYYYKKYFVWIKDSEGRISEPKSINT